MYIDYKSYTRKADFIAFALYPIQKINYRKKRMHQRFNTLSFNEKNEKIFTFVFKIILFNNNKKEKGIINNKLD